MTVEYTIDKSRLAQDTGMIASGPARIGCLVALAHRFEDLLRSGVVKDYGAKLPEIQLKWATLKDTPRSLPPLARMRPKDDVRWLVAALF